MNLGVPLESPQGSQASSRVVTCTSSFLPSNSSSSKGHNSPGRENLLVFVELPQVPLELRRGPQRHARVASGKASLRASCEGPPRIQLQSLLGPKSLSGAEAGA